MKTGKNEYCKLLQAPEGCSTSDIVEKLASSVVDSCSSPGKKLNIILLRIALLRSKGISRVCFLVLLPLLLFLLHKASIFFDARGILR